MYRWDFWGLQLQLHFTETPKGGIIFGPQLPVYVEETQFNCKCGDESTLSAYTMSSISNTLLMWL